MGNVTCPAEVFAADLESAERAMRRPATDLKPVWEPWQRNAGPFGGNTTVSPVANTNGADVKARSYMTAD